MFEYLMPLLVMPNYENTLARSHLQSGRAATNRVRQDARCAVGHFRNRATTGPMCT